MFFNSFSRRRFCLTSIGFVAATLTARRGIAELVAHLEGQKTVVNGEEAFQVVVKHSPTNSVWELQQSTDGKSWTTVSNSVAIGSGKIEWNTASTNKAAFARAKLVTVTITLEGGVSYEVPMITGQTLFTAMTNLMSSIPSFTFESQPYDWGELVTEINGRKRGGGSHWFLFVNGQMPKIGISLIGCSDYIPKGGDKIEWRFENHS